MHFEKHQQMTTFDLLIVWFLYDREHYSKLIPTVIHCYSFENFIQTLHSNIAMVSEINRLKPSRKMDVLSQK